MFRYVLVLACVTGCVSEDPVETVEQTASLGFSREHVTADIYHYELVLPIGSEPNAALRLHRVVREVAPFVPRRTSHAAMLLHGDFSTFTTNFAPALGDPASPVSGLAPYLAARDVDVWGLDRRWTLAGDDVSDFGSMGVAQELDDLRAALAFARATRAIGGNGGKLALVGFSHGGQLAYHYASVEAARPAIQRHVDALVPLDFYGEYDPSQVDERAAACASAEALYGFVAEGFIDSPNDFLINVGALARSAPDDPSPAPAFAGLTNRQAMLLVVGQTYFVAPFAPFYHLLAPILEGDFVVGLSETSEEAATAWLAGATPHQSLLEAADLDALLCGEGAQPIDAPLSRIRVPVFYIGAAGGIGSFGVHSTTQVSSTDVTTLVVQRFGPDQRAEDFGHSDLLFAGDAPGLVWQPLAAWLVQH